VSSAEFVLERFHASRELVDKLFALVKPPLQLFHAGGLSA
jgi:hypothetical protein